MNTCFVLGLGTVQLTRHRKDGVISKKYCELGDAQREPNVTGQRGSGSINGGIETIALEKRQKSWRKCTWKLVHSAMAREQACGAALMLAMAAAAMAARPDAINRDHLRITPTATTDTPKVEQAPKPHCPNRRLSACTHRQGSDPGRNRKVRFGQAIEKLRSQDSE